MSLYDRIKDEGFTDFNPEIKALEERFVQLVEKNRSDIEKMENRIHQLQLKKLEVQYTKLKSQKIQAMKKKQKQRILDEYKKSLSAEVKRLNAKLNKA